MKLGDYIKLNLYHLADFHIDVNTHSETYLTINIGVYTQFYIYFKENDLRSSPTALLIPRWANETPHSYLMSDFSVFVI